MNDVAHIALQLPREPDKELIMLLKRAGANPTTKVTFRPYMVKRALKWLVENNPIYYDMFHNGNIDLSLEGIREDEAVEVPTTVNLTEEEEAAMLDAAESSAASSTSHSEDGETMLLETPPDLISKEADVAAKLRVKSTDPAVRKELSTLRKGDYISPWQDPTGFDAKAFPHLHPYGSGGLPGENHGISDAELVRLHLKRGGDRRFQKSMSFVFEKYSRQTRKAAGGVAMVASAHMGVKNSGGAAEDDPSDPSAKNSGRAAGDDPSDPNVDALRPGVVMGDPISELGSCTTADEILGTLEKDDGKLLKRLLKRLEPFSRGLAGSPLHIAHERKQLLAMLMSNIVTSSGMLSIFGTNAPCDRFNPELFRIVGNSKETKTSKVLLTAGDRAKILREHPALAARIFDAKVTALFKHIYRGEDEPFGHVTDDFNRIEFQGSGQPKVISQQQESPLPST